MDARRRVVATAIAALLCGSVTACAKHVTARTGLGPLGGSSAPPGVAGPGGAGVPGGQGGPGLGTSTPTAAPNPGGTTTHGGGTEGGTGGGGSGGGGTTTSPSASTSTDPPTGPPPGKANPPVFKFPNYWVAVTLNPGKICTWRISPGGTDIAIGVGVTLGYYGSTGPQSETVTLSSDLTTRTDVLTTTPDPTSNVLADMEIAGFGPAASGYTMHLTVTIATTGGDLITSDDTATATVSVPAGSPTHGNYWTTIPCT